MPVFKGTFGPLIIRKADAPRPDVEFFLTLHSFTQLATGLTDVYSCINGRAYAGNTPTLRARVGQTVAFHVFALDNDFHGHRWTDPDGGLVIDNKVPRSSRRADGELRGEQPRSLVLPLPCVLPPAHADERVLHRQRVAGARGATVG